MSEIMTLKECCEYMRVSDKTIRRWIKEKKLPYLKVGRQYRFRTDKIDLWMEENK